MSLVPWGGGSGEVGGGYGGGVLQRLVHDKIPWAIKADLSHGTVCVRLCLYMQQGPEISLTHTPSDFVFVLQLLSSILSCSLALTLFLCLCSCFSPKYYDVNHDTSDSNG